MKFHITKDVELKDTILAGLCENEGYCPCIFESKNKPEYKCLCQDFRMNVPVGETCHCGLYIKDSD